MAAQGGGKNEKTPRALAFPDDERVLTMFCQREEIGLPSTHLQCAARFGLALVLLLLPNSALGWWNDDWTARKPLRIDTSAAGAHITDAIGAMPLLVRLHLGNFRFEAANEDGSDLRFIAGDDQTPLPHHIESYDGLLGEALIWVGIPELKPGTTTELWLYFGNEKAAATEDRKATYGAQTTLVYHFAESAQAPRDSSIWDHHALEVAENTTSTLIGQGLRLDGSSSLTVPESPTLKWAAGASMTWSAWVRPAEENARGVIFSRSEGEAALVVGIDRGLPYVTLVQGEDTQRTGASEALTAQRWTHLAVTAGEQISLHVDGALIGSIDESLPALGTPATLGGMAADALPLPAPAVDRNPEKPRSEGEESLPGFKGDLDELQMAKVERPLGFLRASAISQGLDAAKLLVFGQDEESAGWSSGYFAIILRSVTLDGWVVIVLLAFMSMLSWMVMVSKAVLIGAVVKANECFLERFHENSGDLVGLFGSKVEETLGGEKELSASPLLRIFWVAAEEIQKRTSTTTRFTQENLTAIRASLDTALMHQNQRLSQRMVLLTIAISGGPFLGLLGTVVGVMITFASIAAAGDVNVNAIAPGIAAALVATIAGLAVAIPALFGYNWLLTRIQGIRATMQVFVDELIAKTAEAYAEKVADGCSPGHPQLVIDRPVVASQPAVSAEEAAHVQRSGRPTAAS
jgi:biopolymer transport protein ExbB